MPPEPGPENQYIILPARGLRAETGPSHDMLINMTNDYLAGVEAGVEPVSTLPEGGNVRVLDVVQENGAKLVETDEATAAMINENDRIPLRAVKLVTYRRPDPNPAPFSVTIADASAGLQAIAVQVRDRVTQAPVAGAEVYAFTNFAAREGDTTVTDGAGAARLNLSHHRLDRLYVYPPPNYWGAYRTQVSANGLVVDLEPVSFSYRDSVRHFYGGSRFDPGTGVIVGVVDTGCGPHPDLNLVDGEATVTGDAPGDWQDFDIHGTHVAGLIGANGNLRGMAPGVPIHSFRVFPRNVGDGATNYAILKALLRAADARCDIVNLSLGGGPADIIVEESIADARNQGMLLVIAAGNDGREAVNYPAAYSGTVAVSAMGVEGTFPAGSLEQADILRPPGSQLDPAEFIASFSNVGPQIGVTAPGVGTLSTLPNGDYGPLSGTSMAAPVAAGAAACLLSQHPTVFRMPRDRSRSNAIYNLLVQNCVRRRFGSDYEGFGLPDPAVV
jgi:subtilisin family serine protease